MEFSEEPIPDTLGETSMKRWGLDSPFRRHDQVQQYIEDLVDRKHYPSLCEFNTTVELAEKVGGKWLLTLRKEEEDRDYWYQESFDTVVVASGHYTVPWIPHVEGLREFAAAYPGSVEHTKSYRVAEKYKGKVSLLNTISQHSWLTWQ